MREYYIFMKISLKFLISSLFVLYSVSKLLAALSQLPGGTPAAGAPLLSADRQSNNGILLWEKLNIHPTHGLKSFLSGSMSSGENWPVLFKRVCRHICKTVPLRPASSLSFSSWHGSICNVCKNNSNLNWLSPLNLANDTWHCRKQVKAAGSAPHTCYTPLQTATSLPPPVMWSPTEGWNWMASLFLFLTSWCRTSVRAVPGTPLLYLHGNSPTLEKPSELTKDKVEEEGDTRGLTPQQAKSIKAMKKQVFGEPEPVKPKKKRKGPKGPNPLSCKKKKKKSNDPLRGVKDKIVKSNTESWHCWAISSISRFIQIF